jgi:tetratricopeptide (TPR) repeat protein
MDLSRLKWPLIVALVVGAGWLLSEGGVNYMHKKFTSAAAGQDANLDEMNEQGLTRLGSFLLKTFRYEKALVVMEDAVHLYPDGANALFNEYRMAKCAEKIGDYQRSVDILGHLMDIEASTLDARVPSNNHLNLRRAKLLETHELGEIGM